MGSILASCWVNNFPEEVRLSIFVMMRTCSFGVLQALSVCFLIHLFASVQSVPVCLFQVCSDTGRNLLHIACLAEEPKVSSLSLALSVQNIFVDEIKSFCSFFSAPGLHKLWYPGIRDTSTWRTCRCFPVLQLRCALILRELHQIFIAYLFKGRSRTIFFPSKTLIYGISRDDSKNFNIRTCEHMILGQLGI